MTPAKRKTNVLKYLPDNVNYRIDRFKSRTELWPILLEICEYLKMPGTRAIDYIIVDFYNRNIAKKKLVNNAKNSVKIYPNGDYKNEHSHN